MLAGYAVRKVAEFHRKHSAPVAEASHEVGILRKSLIYEEASELLLALHDRDELELVDAMGDLLYVSAGFWVAFNGDTLELNASEYMPYYQQRGELWSPEFCRQVGYLADNAVQYVSSNTPVLSRLIAETIRVPIHLGYDINGVFDEIHRSNMSKQVTTDIRVRDKGPDYTSPDLRRFLRAKS